MESLPVMLRVSLSFHWNSPSSTESLHLVKPRAGSVRRSEQLSVNLTFLNNLGLYLKHCLFTSQYISLLPSLHAFLLCLHKAVEDPGTGSSLRNTALPSSCFTVEVTGRRLLSLDRRAVWRSAGASRPGGSAEETSIKRKQLREIEENILRQRVPFIPQWGTDWRWKSFDWHTQ